MDFEQAISAHAEWKTRLLKYIEHPNGSLDHRAVCDHTICYLGKWLYGSAAQYKHHAEYKKLLADHVRFHEQAAIIVEKANKGDHVTSNDITSPNSPYIIASHNVTNGILALRRKIAHKPSSPQSIPCKTWETNSTINNIIAQTTGNAVASVAKLVKIYNDTTIPPHLMKIMQEELEGLYASMISEMLNAGGNNKRN